MVRRGSLSDRRWRVVVACIAVMAGVMATAAAANGDPGWGRKYLLYGSCCGGEKLQGTRASIAGINQSPDPDNCILYDSVVGELAPADRQVEDGLARCGGPSGGLDPNSSNNCPNTYDMFKYVETDLNGTFNCYPYGSAVKGAYYEFQLQETTSTSGNYAAAIAGVTELHFGGFDDNLQIQEWGEHTGSIGCNLTWSASTQFDNWQRYNFGPGWYTVQSSYSDHTLCTSGTPWSVGSLVYNSGSDTNYFTVSR